MVKLLNADIFGERSENFVAHEEMKNVKTNAVNYIKHGIYFGDTLDVCTDPADSSTRLSLETDYTFAELDTIATEQSNRDCYRAVVFLKDFAKVYVSYHSYGDLVSAETFNEFIKNIEGITADIDKLNLSAVKILKDFQEHIINEKAHGASESAENEKIAIRTAKGTLRAKAPEESDDLVNLQHLTEALRKLKDEIEKTNTKKSFELFDEIQKTIQKVSGKIQAVILKEFLPEGVDYTAATPEQKEAAEKAAKERTAETKPFFNAVRNENGSVAVPEPKADNEAVNLKTFKTKIEKIIEAVKTAEQTAQAAADKITGLQNSITELKNKKDVFDFSAEAVLTDKTFNGKPVYRKGFQIEIPKDEKKSIKLNDFQIDTIVSIQGMVIKDGETRSLSASGVDAYTTDIGLTVKPPVGYPDCTVKLFLEFIKT